MLFETSRQNMLFGIERDLSLQLLIIISFLNYKQMKNKAFTCFQQIIFFYSYLKKIYCSLKNNYRWRCSKTLQCRNALLLKLKLEALGNFCNIGCGKKCPVLDSFSTTSTSAVPETIACLSPYFLLNNQRNSHLLQLCNLINQIANSGNSAALGLFQPS